MSSPDKIRADLLEFFAGISSFVKKSNQKENQNINFVLERFFTATFQLIQPESKFRQLELDKPNAKNLDIISEDESVGIQVTVDTSQTKIKITLDEIKINWPHLQTLIMVYPVDRKPSRSKAYPHQDLTILEYSFDELTQEIWKKDIEVQNSIHKLIKKHFIRLSEIKYSLEKIESLRYNSFIIDQKKNEKYLPRKITLNSQSSVSQSSVTTNLFELVRKENKVILIGEPGLGKSVELIELANKLANSKIAYPVLLKFKYFSQNKKLSSYLPENTRYIPQQKLVVIIDGFDEISIKSKDSLIQNFNTFLDSYREIKLVISVRLNFYNNVLHEQLESFVEASLDRLEWEEICKYVEEFHEISSDDFLNTCHRQSLLELAEIPYYLESLAKEYKIENGLHGSLSEIQKRLFENRIEYDLSRHFKSSITDQIQKEDIKNILEKISSILTIGGYSQIPHKSVKNLTQDGQLEILKQLMIFNPSTTNSNGQWSFEHNKMRDYLCAKNLSKLNISNIKKIVCLPNSSIIGANWLDVLLILLNTIDTNHHLFQPILNLVVENSTTAVFEIEKVKIAPKLRFQILKQLIEYYKIRTIWLNLKGVRESRVAYFSQSEESLEFLISEIENKTGHRRHRLNCLFILKEFQNLTDLEKGRIKEAFFPILKENQKDDYLSQNFIESCAKLKITDTESEEIFSTLYRNRTNQFIRGGMYEYISALVFPDAWIDYLLEGMLLKDSHEPDRNGIGNGSEGLNLEIALKSLRSSSSLEKALEEFIVNENYEQRFNFDNYLEIILKKSAEFYIEKPSLFDLIIKLKSKLVSSWSLEYIELFDNYFSKTNSYGEGLKKILEKWKGNDDYQIVHEIATFIHESTLTDFNKSFELGLLTFENAKSIFFEVKSLGNPCHEKLKRNIENISGKTIEIPESGNSKNIQHINNKRDLEVWFNWNGLKKEVQGILKRDEELSLEKLSKSIFEGDLTSSEVLHLHHTAKKILRETLNKGFGTKLEIENWINNEEEFETFLIGHIHQIIHHHNPFELCDQGQIALLSSWYERNIDKVNFSTIRIFGESVDMYILHRAQYLSYFFETFNFPTSEQKILEMLGFCNNTQGSYLTVTIPTIIKRVGKKRTEDQIEKNILTGNIQNSMAMRSHFIYVFKNKKEHIFNKIFELITKSHTSDKYNLSELNEFFSSNNDPKFMYPYFSKFFEGDQLFILEKIQDEYLNSDLEFFLEKLSLKNNSEEMERAINSLNLRNGNVKGLINTIEWIRKTKINPFTYKNIELANFSTLEALPYLLDLLILSYDKSIVNNDRFNTIWSKVRVGLIELSKKSDFFANTIIKEMEALIKENPKSIEDIEHNYEIVEDIKSELLKRKFNTEPLTIKKCLKIYDKMFD